MRNVTNPRNTLITITSKFFIWLFCTFTNLGYDSLLIHLNFHESTHRITHINCVGGFTDTVESVGFSGHHSCPYLSFAFPPDLALA